MNSRTVGARIAAILQDEATAGAGALLESSTPSPAKPSSVSSPPRRHRRFRVVLHSSPFLRCVQTSIAISAGLASTSASSSVSPRHGEPTPSQQPTLRPTHASSFSNHSLTNTRSDINISAAANSHHHDHDSFHGSFNHIERSVLRLDPFLGEWLSPEYFEHITPPPKSALMLATAKAELLRRSSYHDYPHFHAIHSNTSSHLWTNLSSVPVHSAHGHSSLDALSQLGDSLPSHGGHANGDADTKGARGASHENHRSPGYVFPVPAYALSTSEPIPRGYVAHARDACVSIDYQWDSSRDTLDWGDGGSLPEEWASMHQRFRRGLRRLVDWYDTTENAGEMVTRTANGHHSSPSEECAIESDDDDDEVEDVVVLVSHGAGCNALIGAITQHPVLTDVAMSSLTMAKRRDGFDSRNAHISRENGRASTDAGLPTPRASMAEMYELKLSANTSHLARPTSPPAFNRSAPSATPNPRPLFNSGYTSALKDINFGSLYGAPSRPDRDQSLNGATGSLRRPSGGSGLVITPSVYNATTGGITVGSGVSSFSITRPDRSGSGTWGLWSPRQEEDDGEKEPETPMFLDFSHEKVTKEKETKASTQLTEPLPTTGSLNEKGASQASDQGPISDHHDEEHDTFDEDKALPSLTGKGNGGLWGAPRPPGEAERIRDFSAHKRRWTVTER